ncbi:hypothetical protein NQZ68_029321 [Dissostichus eleginoides]|nr:hypothetical protein NQZ68_029321 [Dissostichus eleginoides]
MGIFSVSEAVLMNCGSDKTGLGHFCCKDPLGKAQCHQMARQSVSVAVLVTAPSSSPSHRYLERFQPPGKDPVMRGGKKGGRRMRGLDGEPCSDPDVSSGGGGVMLCLFPTLCSETEAL